LSSPLAWALLELAPSELPLDLPAMEQVEMCLCQLVMRRELDLSQSQPVQALSLLVDMSRLREGLVMAQMVEM